MLTSIIAALVLSSSPMSESPLTPNIIEKKIHFTVESDGEFIVMKVYNGSSLMLTRLDLDVSCYLNRNITHYWVPVMISAMSTSRVTFMPFERCTQPKVTIVGALGY